MITDAVLKFFADIADILLGGLETVEFSLPALLLDGVSDFIAFILYVLPMDAVQGIITVFTCLMIFRITVSFIKTVWQLLPIL